MKLELKHLSPYLPYELKLVWNRGINDIEMFQDNISHVIRLANDDEDREDRWKPILRPLSDILNKNEEFLFIYDKLTSFKSVSELLDFKNTLDLSTITYNEVILLLKHHFDIFGLIKAGLAIDINTYKK